MALGYLPEKLLHSRGTPRLLFLPAMSALMAAACLALAFAPLRALYPLSVLTGFAFGGRQGGHPSLLCLGALCCFSAALRGAMAWARVRLSPVRARLPAGPAALHPSALTPPASLPDGFPGGHWTLFPSLVSELFGLARFAGGVA